MPGSPVSQVVALGYAQEFFATIALFLGLPFAALIAGSDAPMALRLVIVPAVAIPVVVCFTLGRALQRRRPWARRATLVFLIPFAALFPVGTWIAWCFVPLLRSDVADEIFVEGLAKQDAQPEPAILIGFFIACFTPLLLLLLLWS